MSPLSIHERIDEIAWDQHYKNIAMEEEESELADWFERSIKDRHIQECVKQALAGKIAFPKAIDQAFDNDCDFQEKLSEFIRYAAETFAKNAVKIKYEG